MKLNKKWSLVLGILTGASICVAGAIGCMYMKPINAFTRGHYSTSKLRLLESALKMNYIGELDQTKLTQGLYEGYVYGLEDRETAYLTAEQLKEYKVISEGKYIGSGLIYSWGLNGQYVIIVEVVKDSPADKAGIKVGDKIVAIDGIKTILSNQPQIIEKMGYSGTETVEYVVTDNEGKNERVVKIKPRVVQVKELESKVLDNEIGYIKLKYIKKDTHVRLEKEVKGLAQKGCKSVILDVRGLATNNLQEAQSIAGLWLDQKTLFYVQDGKEQLVPYQSQPGDLGQTLAVIIDGTTDGTIEGAVAALQEEKRATIIGRTTYGNFKIQQSVELKDQTGLLITVGHLLTSKQKNLDTIGVVPDIEVSEGKESTIEWLTKGSLSEKNDRQLQTAIQVLEGTYDESKVMDK